MDQKNGISNGEHTEILKVAGGKLLRIRLTTRDGKIGAVQFTGDFFLHPEESIEDLEDSLIGLDIEEEMLLSTVQKFFDDYEFVGAAPDDIVALIMSAVNQ